MADLMTWEQYEADVPVECAVCGWKGTTKQAELKMPDETVAELDCPKCQNYNIALIENVIYPQEMRERAAAGDPWCQTYETNQAEIAASLLKSSDKLPDLPGTEKLDFIWDHEGGDANPTVVIHLKDGTVVWKERAYFGGKDRFKEVTELFKRKYGERFGTLEVNFHNYGAGIYYYGD